MDITYVSVIGGFVVSALSILSGIIKSRNTTKRELYKAVYEIAYKEWETKSRMTVELGEKNGNGYTLYPADDYLFYYSLMAPILAKRRIKERDIKRFYKQSNDLMQNINKYRDKKTVKM